jgi:hypothetical protein
MEIRREPTEGALANRLLRGTTELGAAGDLLETAHHALE